MAPLGLLLVAHSVLAQTEPVHRPPRDTVMLRDTSALIEDEAAHILDEPGGSAVDPEDLFDYLDGLSATSSSTLSDIHENPEASWIASHQTMRKWRGLNRPKGDSSSHSSLRSRTSSGFNADEQQGFQTNQYLGSPYAIYNRIRATSSVLEVGVALQKKAWESEIAEHVNGFVSLRNPIPIVGTLQLQRAIAGDYTLSFGDGLLFGGGATAGKSTNAVSGIEQRAFGIRGTLSNAPSSSYRGGAVELGIGPMSISAFVSDRSLDANVQSDTILTLYPTSYYRTPAEVAVKNSAVLRMAGARAAISNDDTSRLFLAAGATAFTSSYDHPYAGTPSQPYIGSAMRAGSVDVLAIGSHISLTGEVALSADDTAHRSAWLLTCVAEPSPLIGVSLLYRHVPYGFVSPFGQISGGAVSSLANANGTYLGLQLNPIEKTLRLNAYADIENSLLPITNLFDNQKHDYLTAAYLTLFENRLDLNLIIRSTESQNIGTVPGALQPVFATVLVDKTNLRFEVAYHVTNGLSFKSRVEYVTVTNSSAPIEHGFLLLQQIRATGLPQQASVQFDVSRFQTDSFNSALYLYQGLVPGSGAIGLLDGKGWHFGVRTTTHIISQLAISLAAAGSIYDSQRTIGSGVTARTGTTDVSGFAQIDITL